MTTKKLAECIVEQAYKYDWSVCCLCDKFNENKECKYFDKTEYEKFCIQGIAKWLLNKNKEVKNESNKCCQH